MTRRPSDAQPGTRGDHLLGDQQTLPQDNSAIDSQLVRDVHADCFSVGLQPPHRRTIVARLEDVDLRKRARRACPNQQRRI